MSRLPEVDIENLDPDQEAFRDQIVASPRGELRGPFVPLLHHPAVGNLIQKVGAQLRFEEFAFTTVMAILTATKACDRT